MLDFFIEIDRALFLFLNGLNNSFFDFLMYYISDKYIWIPLYLVIIFLAYRKGGWSGLFTVLILIALLITFSDRGSVYIKDLTTRSRPCVELPQLGYHVHIVRDKCIQHWGFVSSHAANTFALAMFVVLLFRRQYKFIVPVMFGYAALNSYSRIYLGLHYPGDIIFGALLGVALGWLVYFVWRKISPCSACMA
jgi:undecaprenyl-diphosphatase